MTETYTIIAGVNDQIRLRINSNSPGVNYRISFIPPGNYTAEEIVAAYNTAVSQSRWVNRYNMGNNVTRLYNNINTKGFVSWGSPHPSFNVLEYIDNQLIFTNKSSVSAHDFYFEYTPNCIAHCEFFKNIVMYFPDNYAYSDYIKSLCKNQWIFPGPTVTEVLSNYSSNTYSITINNNTYTLEPMGYLTSTGTGKNIQMPYSLSNCYYVTGDLHEFGIRTTHDSIGAPINRSLSIYSNKVNTFRVTYNSVNYTCRFFNNWLIDTQLADLLPRVLDQVFNNTISGTVFTIETPQFSSSISQLFYDYSYTFAQEITVPNETDTLNVQANEIYYTMVTNPGISISNKCYILYNWYAIFPVKVYMGRIQFRMNYGGGVQIYYPWLSSNRNLSTMVATFNNDTTIYGKDLTETDQFLKDTFKLTYDPSGPLKFIFTDTSGSSSYYKYPEMTDKNTDALLFPLLRNLTKYPESDNYIPGRVSESIEFYAFDPSIQIRKYTSDLFIKINGTTINFEAKSYRLIDIYNLINQQFPDTIDIIHNASDDTFDIVFKNYDTIEFSEDVYNSFGVYSQKSKTTVCKLIYLCDINSFMSFRVNDYNESVSVYEGLMTFENYLSTIISGFKILGYTAEFNDIFYNNEMVKELRVSKNDQPVEFIFNENSLFNNSMLKLINNDLSDTKLFKYYSSQNASNSVWQFNPYGVINFTDIPVIDFQGYSLQNTPNAPRDSGIISNCIYMEFSDIFINVPRNLYTDIKVKNATKIISNNCPANKNNFTIESNSDYIFICYIPFITPDRVNLVMEIQFITENNSVVYSAISYPVFQFPNNNEYTCASFYNLLPKFSENYDIETIRISYDSVTSDTTSINLTRINCYFNKLSSGNEFFSDTLTETFGVYRNSCLSTVNYEYNRYVEGEYTNTTTVNNNSVYLFYFGENGTKPANLKEYSMIINGINYPLYNYRESNSTRMTTIIPYYSENNVTAVFNTNLTDIGTTYYVINQNQITLNSGNTVSSVNDTQCITNQSVSNYMGYQLNFIKYFMFYGKYSDLLLNSNKKFPELINKADYYYINTNDPDNFVFNSSNSTLTTSYNCYSFVTISYDKFTIGTNQWVQNYIVFNIGNSTTNNGNIRINISSPKKQYCNNYHAFSPMYPEINSGVNSINIGHGYNQNTSENRTENLTELSFIVYKN